MADDDDALAVHILFGEVYRGLMHYLHELGIVHGNIAPEKNQGDP